MQCKVRDLDIYYEEAGAGKPLLVLHGMPLDHRHIQHDLEPVFAERKGWRRIYPDLPGMGKTRAADWITDQDHMLDIILDFIDAVAPGERFAVAGTSYGSYPDFLAALTPSEQDLRDIVVVQSIALLDDTRRFLAPAGAIADQPFLDRLRPNSFSFEVDSLPQPFPAPTLILTGRFDPWVGYREAYQLLDNYPRATFAVLDRAGHALAIEQPVLFRALTSEWLDRVEEFWRQKEEGSRQ